MSLKYHQQRGTTLITTLIMLVVLTLLVLSGVKSSTINLRIAGNTQIQEETIAAAQQGIEHVISNNFTGFAATAASTINVDINNDGSTDYQVQVATPVCNGTTNLPANTAGLPDACRKGNKYDPNDTSTSDCSRQQWDVAATATETAIGTGATATIHQGVSTLVLLGTACPAGSY